MRYDFHTHSFLSDGVLSPIELTRRAVVNGCVAMAVTDHAGPGNVEAILEQLLPECAAASRYWPILALPGVEITHVPAAMIADVARRARAAGAQIIAVHGETVTEPVEPGTNRAAIDCDEVDILAHPGLLTPEDAARAAARGCYIEVSGRKGHAYANGHAVQVARAAGAHLLLNSDAHEPGDLLSERFASIVLRGAGVPESEHTAILLDHPRALLARVQNRR